MPDMAYTSDMLRHIQIVLVEPAGPLNVGSISRVMKNMGLYNLVVVQPRCQLNCSAAQRMAVHAVDVLESAQIVGSLPEALVGCQRAIATTTRPRALDITLESPEAALPWLLGPGLTSSNLGGPRSEQTFKSALIFGPEERGLSNEELIHAQRFVRIPANPDYPSLNLAQAVSVCCYVLYSSHLNDEEAGAANESVDAGQAAKTESVAAQFAEASASTASLEVLEGYYQHLEKVLLKIGYLYPHTAESRMQKFRRLFNQAHLSETDVSMLRGILRQMEWKLSTVTQAHQSNDAENS